MCPHMPFSWAENSLHVVAAHDEDISNHRSYQFPNTSNEHISHLGDEWRHHAQGKKAFYMQPPSQTDLIQRRIDGIFPNCKEIGWLGNAHFALKVEIFDPRCWQPCHFPRMEISDVREFMDAGHP